MTRLHKSYNCDIFFPKYDKSSFVLKRKIEATNNIFYYIYNNKEESELLNFMKNILKNGNHRPDRTSTGTISLFGNTLKYNMLPLTSTHEENDTYILPMITSKKMWFKGIAEELLWFLRGETNSKILEDKGINIWKGNSTREFLDSRGLNYPEGENGPIYGYQWRKANGIDQISNIIEGLKKDPFSRRHILSAWNVSELDKMSLVPCHVMYQFYVEEKMDSDSFKIQKYLSCSMYQRSGDMFLGVPFNITSTCLLTLLIAHQVGMKPYNIIHTIGDAHIYNNHVEQVIQQLKRNTLPFPRIKIINTKENIEEYTLKDLQLIDYIYHPSIKAKMAV